MIGIICAMKIEADAIRETLTSPVCETVSGIEFTRGSLHGKEVVMAVCGIGKVFAAICTEAMILRYAPSLVLNSGVGGTLTPALSIGDIAVATSLVQHDMDTSALGDPVGLISGINKTPAFIEELVANTDGRIYTVESLTQFQLMDRLSVKYGKKLKILLRLTNDSQFGINEEEIEALVRYRGDHPGLDYRGLQFFSGTQKTSLKKLRREILRLDELLTRLETDCGWRSPELEYGPGFPVSYFGEELDEEALILGLKQLLEEMRWQGEITLELGRSMAACCGRYFTHVADLKNNHGQNYLILDGGMHQMVYYGQYIGMKLPKVTLCGKETLPPAKDWNLCGSLCSMNDILVKGLPLPEVGIGDTLCFFNTGAYCVTEGIALFLSRDLPAVYLVNPDGCITCARETTETYPQNMPNRL